MSSPDTKPGTLSGYAPVAETADLQEEVIGPERALDVFEEASMLLLDFNRGDIVNMTPVQLQKLADIEEGTSAMLLGC